MGVIYMGSQIDSCLYIVYQDLDLNYTFKTIPLGTQPLCGLLTKNDTVLLIGGSDENILYFQFEDGDMLDPLKKREVKFSFNVTCIVPLDINETHFFIGQEQGRIDVLSIMYMETLDPTFVLDTHDDFKKKTTV